MKLTFTSPLKYVDGTAIDATVLASLTYQVFIDTVSPPVKSYPVAAAALSAAVVNADGTKTVTVDCVKGDATGFTPVLGTKYYCAVEDTVDENGNAVTSPSSAVVAYTYEAQPSAPSGFTVAS